jgi:hypothetical protein
MTVSAVAFGVVGTGLLVMPAVLDIQYFLTFIAPFGEITLTFFALRHLDMAA